MNESNPYETPKTSARRLSDGSYRPGIGDWLILFFLLPLVFVVAFLATCFGSGFALIGLAGPHFSDAWIVLPFVLGGIAAIGMTWLVTTRYFRAQRRWHATAIQKEKDQQKIVDSELKENE